MFIDLSPAARSVQPTVAPRPLRRTESCLNIGGIDDIEWLASGINEIKKLETSFDVLLSPKEKPAHPQPESENTSPPLISVEDRPLQRRNTLHLYGPYSQENAPSSTSSTATTAASAGSLSRTSPPVERQPPTPVLSPPSFRQANPLERQKHSFFRLPSLLSLIQTVISPKKSQGTAPRPTERKSRFSNIRDISSSTSRNQPASSSTPGEQRESAMAIDRPSSHSSRRSEKPLQREEMECFFVSLLRAEAETTSAHELGGAPKALSRTLRRRVLDDQPLSRKAKPTPNVLGSEHYQRGALHIPYECYEKVILPGKEGREGYHIPIGAAMQQYNPCRKILVTAESLASFEGVTAPILKKYKKHFMTRKRIYADGIYVDKAITIEQELDDCDKDDKGRENVTITVLPNQFVYAVIGEEVKAVDVKPSYFGPGMDEDLDSVRDKKICDSILIDQKYDQTFGRKQLEDVAVVWPEEEEDRPAKRVRYNGVLTVVMIYTDTVEETDDDVEG